MISAADAFDAGRFNSLIAEAQDSALAAVTLMIGDDRAAAVDAIEKTTMPLLVGVCLADLVVHLTGLLGSTLVDDRDVDPDTLLAQTWTRVAWTVADWRTR